MRDKGGMVEVCGSVHWGGRTREVSVDDSRQRKPHTTDEVEWGITPISPNGPCGGAKGGGASNDSSGAYGRRGMRLDHFTHLGDL